MIGYLHGRVIALYTDHCLLDVHGVGYRVFVANSTRTKLPGIGKKSAERLILELKDKVAFRDSGEEELLTIENDEEVGDDAASEAMAALQSLGYTPSEIAPVIRKTAKYKTTEAIIKASLKELSHM